MIDNIKMDNIMPQSLQGKMVCKETVVKSMAEEGIMVTNHLSKLVNLLIPTQNEMTEDNSKVMHLKDQIAAGQYKVDVETLADKLLSNGILKN